MTDETSTRPALADIREYPFGSPGEHTGYRVFLSSALDFGTGE